MTNRERGPVREILSLFGALAVLLGGVALLGAGFDRLPKL